MDRLVASLRRLFRATSRSRGTLELQRCSQ